MILVLLYANNKALYLLVSVQQRNVKKRGEVVQVAVVFSLSACYQTEHELDRNNIGKKTNELDIS